MWHCTGRNIDRHANARIVQRVCERLAVAFERSTDDCKLSRCISVHNSILAFFRPEVLDHSIMAMIYTPDRVHCSGTQPRTGTTLKDASRRAVTATCST